MDFNIDNEIKAMMENPQFELDQQFVIGSDVVVEDVVEDVVVEDVVVEEQLHQIGIDTSLSGYTEEFLNKRVYIKPFSQYDEEMKRAPRMTIHQYLAKPIPPKEYVDLDVGFFGLCSYQPQAWEYVFKSVRDFYPNSPIVLINDGSNQFDYKDMSEKYKCIHLPRRDEICLHWYNIEYAYEFLHRLKMCCDLTKKEWLIHLHPDVICCDRISKYPPSPLAGVSAGSWTGKSNNKFNQKVDSFIKQYQPHLELNGYGWCGGSIVHVPTFLEIYDSIVNKKNWDLFKLRDELGQQFTEHEDVFMSLLFNLHGYPYRLWLDNPEHQRGQMGMMDAGAFLHGFKDHYKFQNNENITEYYRRVREENAKVQKVNDSKIII